MKKLIIIISIFMFFGCNQNTRNKYKEDIQPVSGNGYPYNIKGIVTIEGCEYLKERVDGCYIYIHKGNCKNSIHKCKCSSETN